MGWLDCGLGASQLLCTGYAFITLFSSYLWLVGLPTRYLSLIVPPKANGCKMHSAHSLSGPSPL